jgi:tetratricopeptide (TPR) repeat protein
VSERERLEISATYYRHITGELEKRIETSSLLTETYPQDAKAFHIHGNSLVVAGEFEQAAAAYRKALLLDPDYSLSRANLALALIGLNRFAEAKEAIQQGIARGLDTSGFHSRLYLIAFVQGDSQEAARQLEWFAGKPEEYQILEFQARSLAFAGRRREAKRIFAQAAALAEARRLQAEKARILIAEANLDATFGMKQLARNQAAVLMTLLEKERIKAEEVQPSLIGQLDSQPLDWTLALCGDARRAQSVAADFTSRFPLDTVHNTVWLPLIRATLELENVEAQHGSIETRHAPGIVLPSRQYEAALNFRPTWVRAEAFLREKNGALAAAEFQRIIDHRGWDVLSPLWPMAHLGLARATVLQGDLPKARHAYEEFFALWKDADTDLPVLIQARREYNAVGGRQ